MQPTEQNYIDLYNEMNKEIQKLYPQDGKFTPDILNNYFNKVMEITNKYSEKINEMGEPKEGDYEALYTRCVFKDNLIKIDRDCADYNEDVNGKASDPVPNVPNGEQQHIKDNGSTNGVSFPRANIIEFMKKDMPFYSGKFELATKLTLEKAKEAYLEECMTLSSNFRSGEFELDGIVQSPTFSGELKGENPIRNK